MPGFAKRALGLALRPLAWMRARVAQPLERAWAHTVLSEGIEAPLDASVVVLGVPELHGTGRMRLGADLYLYRELYLETREEGSITIGDGVVISRGVHIVSFAAISVGAGSMIGEYTSLRDANHRLGAGPIRSSGHDAKPIVIGSNVWIGRGSIVLPGVSIGDGAVVGANAVVTRDVRAGAIVAGVPAREIRAPQAPVSISQETKRVA